MNSDAPSEGEQSGERFSHLLHFAVEQANDGIAIIEFTSDHATPIRIVYANPAIERISGFTRRELMAPENPFLAAQPQNRPRYQELLARVRAGESVQFSIVLTGRDRATRAQIRWSPLAYAGHEVTHYVAVVRDVTEAKEAQDQRDLLFNAIEQSREGMAILEIPESGIQGRRVIYANGALREMLRVSPEQLDPRDLNKRFFGEHPDLRDAYFSAVTAGEPFEAQVHALCGDDQRRWIHVVASPLRGESGRVERVAVTYRDVDAQFRTLQELELLRSILSEMSDLVVCTDASADPRITYANPAFAMLFGDASTGVIGTPLATYISSRSDPRTVADTFARISRGESIFHELLLRGRSGDDIWVELTGHPVRGEHGRITSWFFIGRDISVKKRGYAQTAQLATALDLAEQPITIYAAREGMRLEVQHRNERAALSDAPSLDVLFEDPRQAARFVSASAELRAGKEIVRLFAVDEGERRRWASLEIRPMEFENGAPGALIAIEHAIHVGYVGESARQIATMLALCKEIVDYPDLEARKDAFEEVLHVEWGITPTYEAAAQPGELALSSRDRSGTMVFPGDLISSRPVRLTVRWPEPISAARLTALRIFLETIGRS